MSSEVPSEKRLVEQARAGDMDALETLVRLHQSWIFNLALRMVWRRTVAEDATQEILIKAVTKLSTFNGQSALRTWLYRIAVNHLLNVRKSEMEERNMTFTDMGRSLEAVADEELVGSRGSPVEIAVLADEAKLGCITAMLMCLDRRQRLAFILGEIFGEPAKVGAAAMEVSPENFRQLLSRARRDLYQFMRGNCGLVHQTNSCRCARKASGFIKNGWLDPDHLQFSKDRLRAVEEVAVTRLTELDSLDREHAALYRAQPFLAGPDLALRLRELLAGSEFGR